MKVMKRRRWIKDWIPSLLRRSKKGLIPCLRSYEGNDAGQERRATGMYEESSYDVRKGAVEMWEMRRSVEEGRRKNIF